MTLGIFNRRSALAGLGSLLVAGQASAAGFQLNDHGTAAMGRANAVIATIDDPSAIYYNPAGLTNVKETQLYLGVTAISPHGAYEGIGLAPLNPSGAVVEQSASSAFVPVPNLYLSRALSEKAYVGFGVYLPYGLGINWEDPNFVGRTVVQELSLRTYFLTPAIALKLSDMISVGASVSLVPATVYLRRAIGTFDGSLLFPGSGPATEGRVELAGSAFGVGANAGVQVTLIDHLKLGFSFRSAIDLSFTGDVDFQLPDGVPTEIQGNFPDGPVDASVTLPHCFNLGIGWQTEALTFEAGVQLTLWESYEELRINFQRQLPQPSSAAPRNWEASPLFKAGLEYRISDAAIRVGGGYDLTPAPTSTVDVTLPDRDRAYFSVGGGYKFGMFRADLAYTGLITMEREVAEGESITFPATGVSKYPSGFVHLIGLSLGAQVDL